jgi:hypothetical protein
MVGLIFLAAPCGAQTKKVSEVHEDSKEQTKTINVQLDQKPEKQRTGTALDWAEALSPLIQSLTHLRQYKVVTPGDSRR